MSYKKYIPQLDKKISIKMSDNIWTMWPNRFYVDKYKLRKSYNLSWLGKNRDNIRYEGKYGKIWLQVSLSENYCDISIDYKGTRHVKDRRWTHPEVVHQIKQDLLKYKLEQL